MAFLEFKIAGGLNRKSAASDIQDSQVQQAEGCRYDISGAVSSERGRKIVNTLTQGKIQGYVETYRGGTKRRVVKAGTDVMEEESGYTSIGTFPGDNYMTGVSFNDRVYMADGTTLATWDGTTFLTTIGLEPPATAPGLSAAGSGGNFGAGTFKYVYTYYNGVAESNFSPVASVTTVANDKVTVTITAGAAGTTKRRIYRTDLGGSSFFFLAEVGDNTTLTYDDVGGLPPDADAEATEGDDLTTLQREPVGASEAAPVGFKVPRSTQTLYPGIGLSSTAPAKSTSGPQVVMSNLGVLANWVDHDPPPAGLEGLIYHQGQLFGISGNDVVFSRVEEPEHWPILNSFRPGRQNAETPMALFSMGGNVVIYTDTNIYMLVPIGTSFEDSRLVDIHSPVGLAAKRGVAQVLMGSAQEMVHVFVAKSGIFVFDGVKVREMSFDIESIFDAAQRISDPDSVSPTLLSNAVANSHRDKVWISYSHLASNDRTLFIDFQDPRAVKFAIQQYGFTMLATEHKDQLAIGGDDSGNIFQLDTGNKNGLADLPWTVRSKQYPITTENSLVALESVMIDADLGNIPTTVTVTTDSGKSASFSVTADGRQRIVRDLPHYMKGSRVDVKLTSTGSAQRHWYGVGFNVRQGVAP